VLLAFAAFASAFAAFSSALAVLMVAQASVKVVLLVKVASLVLATEALAWKLAIFVALFLVFSASLVSLAARATIFVNSVMVSQSSSVASAAEMTAQVETRVVFDCMVASSVAAVEALASNSAILVALFFVFSASLVLFAAMATVFSREAISLQRDLSVTALVVLFPFATTAVERRRDMKMLVNCILATGSLARGG
jgi:hypothetical protein